MTQSRGLEFYSHGKTEGRVLQVEVTRKVQLPVRKLSGMERSDIMGESKELGGKR